jgi:release factor glutamine methyltransferase
MSEGQPTVLELLTLAAGYLQKKGVDHARREADALLGHVLELDRLHLYLEFETRPSKAEVDRFRELMKRRGQREPQQYLIGQVSFNGLTLKVDPRALIPRPETEALAQRLKTLLPEKAGVAMDLGTGTGCLALSLAKAGCETVLATDLSADALALAKENAELNGLQLQFAQGPLLDPWKQSGVGALDLLVSNPPYINDGEALQEELRSEPALALFGGPDGLAVLRPLLAQAPDALKPGGWLALECGLGQPEILAEQARRGGAFSEIRIEKDPFNLDRFLIARRA